MAPGCPDGKTHSFCVGTQHPDHTGGWPRGAGPDLCTGTRILASFLARRFQAALHSDRSCHARYFALAVYLRRKTSCSALLAGWSNPPSECCGNWTSDGKTFIFQANRPEGSNIWMLPERRWTDALPPLPSPLTAGPLNFVGPVPARQGSHIYFTGAHKRSQLRRYDPATRQFIPYLRDIGMAGRTELSRDGTRVAWVSNSDGCLWQSRLDGTHHLQLTSRPMRVFMMRWSPDARLDRFHGQGTW